MSIATACQETQNLDKKLKIWDKKLKIWKKKAEYWDKKLKI
jgi:hypothetical protein